MGRCRHGLSGPRLASTRRHRGPRPPEPALPPRARGAPLEPSEAGTKISNASLDPSAPPSVTFPPPPFRPETQAPRRACNVRATWSSDCAACRRLGTTLNVSQPACCCCPQLSVAHAMRAGKKLPLPAWIKHSPTWSSVPPIDGRGHETKLSNLRACRVRDTAPADRGLAVAERAASTLVSVR